MNLRIVKFGSKHVEEVVDIHMMAFQRFFLTFLGPRFLTVFYDSFTYDSAGVGFVAIDADNEQVIGAVVGPVETAGYFKRLLKHRFWAFSIPCLVAVLKKPTVAKRLFRAIFYRGEPPPGLKRALLSSVAVSPEYQKRGVGKVLVREWMEEAEKRGANGCYLTTDASNNDTVNNFYTNLGWTLESTYKTPEGREMNRYVFDFVCGKD